MEIDELFPVAETLQLLRFAELEGGDLKLTEEGMAFAHAALLPARDEFGEVRFVIQKPVQPRGKTRKLFQ